jgi:hypothetical protein
LGVAQRPTDQRPTARQFEARAPVSFLCVDYARDRCAFWLTAPIGTWRILLPFVPVVTAVGLVIYGVCRSQPMTAWSAVGLILLTWPILLMGLAGWP